MQQDIEQKVGEILKALRPYRHDLVVVGGICTSIYHREKQGTISEQLFTTDLDLSSEGKRIEEKDQSIRDCLARLGFTSNIFGWEPGKRCLNWKPGRDVCSRSNFWFP